MFALVRRTMEVLKERIYLSGILRKVNAYTLRQMNAKEGVKVQSFRSAHKEEYLVGIVGRALYMFEHLKDVFFDLQSNEKCTPFVVGNMKDSNASLEKKYNIKEGQESFRYCWLPVIKPDILISPAIDSYGDLCPGAVRVLYAHGLAALGFSKDFRHILRIKKYQYLFLTGPMQRKALGLAQEKYGGELPEMVEIGYLRGDQLLAQKIIFNKGSFLNELNLEDKPTVLYAPTWGEFSSASNWIDVIVELCAKHDLNLLLRLHPLMLKGDSYYSTGGINWGAKLQALSHKHQNIRVMNNDDINPILLGADILITDVSSVGVEFLILEKPAVFLPVPEYSKLYGHDGPVTWVRQGREVENQDDLDKVLSSARTLDIFPKYPLEEIMYHPGRSVEKVREFIEMKLKK